MLAVNKESMWIDPIDWPAFKEDLVDWANKHCPNLNIDSNTDSRFRERLVPSHSPRALAHGINEIPCIYQLFSPVTPNHESVKEMVLKGVPIHMANLIYKISKHNPLLSAVGILPNQLRSILKETTHNFDEAFDDIAYTLFFQAYQIWKTRRTMMSRYWKDIAQEEWNPTLLKEQRKLLKCWNKKNVVLHFTFLSVIEILVNRDLPRVHVHVRLTVVLHT